MNKHSLILACVALCGASPSSAGGQGAPTTVPHIAVPKQTGNELISRLNATPAGRTQLSAAGITVASTSAPQQAAAGDGWPATFDLTIDATSSMSAGLVVGARSVAASFEHRNVVASWDNAGQLAVTWVAAAGTSSTSVLSIGPLPAGWYMLAINLHFDGTIPPSTKIQFSDAFGSGTCTAAAPDAQGNTACIALEQIRGAVSHDQFLIGMLGDAQARLLGMTLSRVHQ